PAGPAPTARFSAPAPHRLDRLVMLGDATRLSRAAFDNRVRALGLTGASARALFILAKEDGLSQIELARRLDVSRMALGQTIDRLEKSGHVERRPDPTDRRVWRLHLTKAANDLLPHLAELAADNQAQILENMPEQEVEALKLSLRKITERLRSMPIQLLTEDDPVVGQNAS
ncbi:MAG: MarR family transcriptional regulator, partial [Caulobacterales bacterium]